MEEELLKKEIKAQMLGVAERILDYCDVAVPDVNIYKKLRSKVLRVCNNSIRNLHEFIDTDGEINEAEFIPYDNRPQTIIEYVKKKEEDNGQA